MDFSPTFYEIETDIRGHIFEDVVTVVLDHRFVRVQKCKNCGGFCDCASENTLFNIIDIYNSDFVREISTALVPYGLKGQFLEFVAYKIEIYARD